MNKLIIVKIQNYDCRDYPYGHKWIIAETDENGVYYEHKRFFSKEDALREIETITRTTE